LASFFGIIHRPRPSSTYFRCPRIQDLPRARTRSSSNQERTTVPRRQVLEGAGGHLDDVFPLVEQFIASGVCLHQRVPMPSMHHFRVNDRLRSTGRARNPSRASGKSTNTGISRSMFAATTHHQTVAVGEACDPPETPSTST
jgi:hypothetical protein